jgi:hypothetical protein
VLPSSAGSSAGPSFVFLGDTLHKTPCSSLCSAFASAADRREGRRKLNSGFATEERSCEASYPEVRCLGEAPFREKPDEGIKAEGKGTELRPRHTKAYEGRIVDI